MNECSKCFCLLLLSGGLLFCRLNTIEIGDCTSFVKLNRINLVTYLCWSTTNFSITDFGETFLKLIFSYIVHSHTHFTCFKQCLLHIFYTVVLALVYRRMSLLKPLHFTDKDNVSLNEET